MHGRGRPDQTQCPVGISVRYAKTEEHMANPLKRFWNATQCQLIPLGIDLRKRREDRIVLEDIVFPELLSLPDCRRILFVGCAWYTSHYPRIFRERTFYTLEIAPEEAKYGSPHHIIDSCVNIDQHFQESSLDAVIMNGVYGFGLNDMGQIEQTLTAIFRSLRPHGQFIFGWNDLPGHNPYSMTQIEQIAPFDKYQFPPLNSHVHESKARNRHRFHFYRKPAA